MFTVMNMAFSLYMVNKTNNALQDFLWRDTSAKGHRFTNRGTGSEIQFEPTRFSKNEKCHETAIQRSKSIFDTTELQHFSSPIDPNMSQMPEIAKFAKSGNSEIQFEPASPLGPYE